MKFKSMNVGQAQAYPDRVLGQDHSLLQGGNRKPLLRASVAGDRQANTKANNSQRDGSK